MGAFISLLAEATIIITQETMIFALVYTWVEPWARDVVVTRTPPTLSSLVTLGLLYKLIILYGTLSQQNTIQVVGLCVYSVTLCIYNGIQYELLWAIAQVLKDNGVIRFDTWEIIRRIVMSIIANSAVFTLWMFSLAWKLYREFAWVTFRLVEADLAMRRRFLYSQVFLALLKFGGFYALGFLVQRVGVVAVPGMYNDGRLLVPIVLIPTTCFLLFASAWAVRHENRSGTIVIIFLHTVLLAYYLWAIATLYNPEYANEYLGMRKALTFFGTITVLISVSTIAMAWTCFRNFKRGLRPYVSGDRKARALGEAFEVEELQRLHANSPHREHD
ncbi:hypothetical protein BJX62DRAFT_228798 [Aspergillus germanicus]